MRRTFENTTRSYDGSMEEWAKDANVQFVRFSWN
jgi:3-mercaptopyruvate sulfurtransferase SseA